VDFVKDRIQYRWSGFGTVKNVQSSKVKLAIVTNLAKITTSAVLF